jgi:hypothetical protein
MDYCRQRRGIVWHAGWACPAWRTPRCRIDDRCPIENRSELS